MKSPIYQVDAFTEQVFGGNPAAVCPLEEWLSDSLMQRIAMENNLSETAFFVKEGDTFGLRWFTPAVEVDLCGHATLATAHVLYSEMGYEGEEIHFDTRSGRLIVKKEGDRLLMDFPTDDMPKVEAPPILFQALGISRTSETYKTDDYMVVLGSEKEVASLSPDFKFLKEVDARGIIVTAPGTEVDFVSRFFAPQSGIDEDPVTGSAHTKMTPYWAKRLGKMELEAIQISDRKGHLTLRYKEDRLEIIGKAVTYLRGEIEI
ncbi:MAG: PhzF family phenazine biosynthesis protein [Balneolales bacterium]|nr:PhzF family phenazine biosynthesis protein [Balneolales bacterium]